MDSLFQAIKEASPFWAYSLLFVSAFVENIFPPIPGDTAVVLGAYLVGRGTLNFWGVYLSTTLGSIFGFMGIYGIAFWLEWKVIERYQPRWISRTHIDKVEDWFRHYGYWIIVFNRFLSGVRSVISLVAGLSKMKAVKVFLLALVSSALWNGGLIYLGAMVGENWEAILDFLKVYNRVVVVLIVGVIAIYFGHKMYRKNRTS
jgi:membrane protein DedA with SNARE-associated domain